MTGVRGLVGTVWASLALLASCSLFVDSGDLSSGAGVADAGGALIDSTSVAEGAVSDASGDGPPGVDGGRPTCEATFCDDFDREPLGVTWASLDQGAGALSLSDDVFASSPFSLFAAPFITVADPKASALFRGFAGPARRTTLDAKLQIKTINGGIVLLEIRVDPPPPGFTAVIAALSYLNGSYQIEVVQSPGGLASQQFAVDFSTTFKHVRLVTDFETKLFQMTVDGLTRTLPLPDITLPQGVRVGVGATHAHDQTERAAIHVDDVSVKVE